MSKKVRTDAEKNKDDFGWGLVGCWLGNAVLVILALLLYTGLQASIPSISQWLDSPLSSTPMSVREMLTWGLPWVLNIGVIILTLVKHRPYIALGMLASYALAFFLVLILEWFLNWMNSCFGNN